ncbi:hypothetical protein D6D00_03001 [Aureobasidium pullulans]|nr:hypothetical protein D6D00_03001 [Aureobasidium pullulans]
MSTFYDEEKAGRLHPDEKDVNVDVGSAQGSTEVVNEVPEPQGGILGTLCGWEATLDRKLGIESQAIRRKLPEEKVPQKWHNQAVMALLWSGGIMNLSCMSTGFLGPTWHLTLGQSICITIFGTLLGASVAGWCATLGPGTGLRSMSITRYSFGWYPTKLIAVLNIISQAGWSAVGCITGGLALTAVSDGKVSSALGCVIIALGSSIINFCGLKAILYYEKYAWLVFFIVFMIMYGMAAPHAVNIVDTQLHGANLAGNVLSLLSVVYGSSCSWATIAADYYVHYPINTSKVKVFVLCTLGISIPTCIGMVLGCCVGTAMQVNQDWRDTYTDDGLGYLIQKMLFPRGFAKFVLVLLVLSAVGMNALNLYSCALSIQQFARPLAKVPRTFWVLIVFGAVTAIAVAGRDHLLEYLENFLSLLGYWGTSYFVIVFVEHYWFRKGDFANYDLDGWNTPSRLPIGLAGLTAFLIGVIGWCLGMVETWFTGPLAIQIGEGGGDIANELTFAFTLLAYIPLRHLELHFFKR